MLQDRELVVLSTVVRDRLTAHLPPREWPYTQVHVGSHWAWWVILKRGEKEEEQQEEEESKKMKLGIE